MSISWTSRVRESLPPHHGKQSFHHARSSLGATGHWIREAGILAPLVIGEFVKDNDKRWRYIRIASIATALLSEGLYTHHVHQQREEVKARQEERCPAYAFFALSSGTSC